MRAIVSPIAGASGHSDIKPGDWYLDASGRNQVRRHNLSAASAPTPQDDCGDGYSVGSLWVDVSADAAYVCLDASQGAAVWHALLSGSGSAGYVPQWSGAHVLEAGPIYCNGSGVVVEGAISGSGTVSGSHLQDLSLTSGRVVYVGPDGLLTDSAGLEYDGTRLRVTSNDPAGTGMLDLKYAADGGAASIAWINSSGTRLWRIGGGVQMAQSELAFDEGTTSRLYLQSGGNVGIGTTAPQEKLHVAGTVYGSHLRDSSLTSGRVVYAAAGGQLADSADLTFDATGLAVNNVASVTGGSTIPSGLNGLHLLFASNVAHIAATQPGTANRSLLLSGLDLTFQTKNGSAAGKWDSAGRLGIGTTAPASQLHVATTSGGTSASPGITIDQSYAAGGDSLEGLRLTTNADQGGAYFHAYPVEATWAHNAEWISGTGWVARGTAASMVRLSDGACHISSATGLTPGQAISNLATRMSLLASGWVGIGTAEPGAKLHVYGGNAAVTQPGGTTVDLVLDQSGIRAWHLQNLASSGDLSLTEGGVNAMYWQKDTGNVGVGTTVPSARLHIAASTGQPSTAPLKLTAGSLLGTPEEGAEEYDGSTRYITLSGGSRKGYVLDDGARLTSGRIPAATSGGRLVDGPSPAPDGTYTNPTSITISKGIVTAIS